ncbi:MAG TPA: phosphate ABC transporter substrate-binding protein PstS [Acidimicrobiales bacterium]|nr:phosphate ABC transporter substrate-binding protein PstS [Acidimicrobiales bacterium]
MSRAKRLVPAVAAGAALALTVALPAAGAAKANKVKLPKSGVESPSSGTVSETGSSLIYPLFNLWVGGYNQTYPQVAFTTASPGSGTGITDAANGTANIGASDAYLSTSELQATPTLQNIPLAISAQLVVYNVPGVTAHLKLNGKVLSAIYQGKITNWSDPKIAALNKEVTLPTLPIVTLHRADSSGDTFLFTSYLSKATPSGWGATLSYNTTITWPKAPGALAETGNSGMVSACKTTKGCIAYVGISYQTQALQASLGYAQLQNKKGAYILPSAASIAAEAASFANTTPKDGTISLIYGPAKTGYPIINYEYAIVNSKQTTATVAKNIRSILEWAVNPKLGNSATYLAQVNFQALPPKVEANSIAQILKVK